MCPHIACSLVTIWLPLLQKMQPFLKILVIGSDIIWTHYTSCQEDKQREKVKFSQLSTITQVKKDLASKKIIEQIYFVTGNINNFKTTCLRLQNEKQAHFKPYKMCLFNPKKRSLKKENKTAHLIFTLISWVDDQHFLKMKHIFTDS